MTRYAILALMGLAACDGTGKSDSGDSTTTPGDDDDTTGCASTGFDNPPVVQSYNVTCTDTTHVTFAMDTQYWTGGGIVFSQETANSDDPYDQWADNHDLESTASDSCGLSDHLERSIETGVAFGTDERNVSTIFSCEPDVHFDAASAVMSYAFLALDTDGNDADCLAGGDDPQGMIDGTYNRANEPDFDLSLCVIGNRAM